MAELGDGSAGQAEADEGAHGGVVTRAGSGRGGAAMPPCRSRPNAAGESGIAQSTLTGLRSRGPPVPVNLRRRSTRPLPAEQG